MLRSIETHATSLPLILPIEGMTCAACARRVEKVLESQPGVRSAAVNLALERAEVVLDPDRRETADLAAAVARAGFRIVADDAEAPGAAGYEPAGRDASRAELLQLLAAAALTLPLLLPMALAWLGWSVHFSPWVELALATPVQLVIGARFYRGAWH